MRFLFATCSVLAFASIQGCAEVKPWERGVLSHPAMDAKNPPRAVRETFMRHCFDVREGSSGGNDSPGGGCGCN